MKKNILVVLFVLAFSYGASAQEFQFGFKITPLVSFPSITDDDRNSLDNVESSNKVGFGGGLVANYYFVDNVGFSSGVQIVSKGFAYDFGDNTNGGNYDARITSVEIPLALRMRSNEFGSGLRIHGTFGASMNFTAGANTTGTEFVDGESTKIDTRATDRYKTVIPDFIVGMGVDYELGDIGTLSGGLMYHHGLGLTSDEVWTQKGRIKISYFALELGYFF